MSEVHIAPTIAGYLITQALTLLISGDARLPLVVLLFILSETMLARLDTGQLPLETGPSEFFWVLGILKEEKRKTNDSSEKLVV